MVCTHLRPPRRYSLLRANLSTHPLLTLLTLLLLTSPVQAAPPGTDTPSQPTQVTGQTLRSQIRALESQIFETPKAKRASLYFKLAQLFSDLSALHQRQADRLAHKKGTASVAHQRAQKEAKRTLRKASRIYYKLLSGYPRYTRLCETYFNLGESLTRMGKAKVALKVYRTLLQKYRYPACRKVPHAVLAFAEYYFSQGMIRQALKAYQKVIAFGRTELYGFALYKSAWSYYNLVRYRAALKQFVAVVHYLRSRKGLSQRQRKLLREASRDLLLPYSQVAKANLADAFLARIVGKAHTHTLLVHLASLYTQQGKTHDAITVYTALQRSDPTHKLLYQLRIFQATRATDQKVRSAQTLIKMLQARQAHAPTDKAVKEVRRTLHPLLKHLAKQRHYEAQKLQSIAFYKQASSLYRAFLGLYPQDKDVVQIRFYLAEILYKRKRYNAAASLYQATFQHDPKGKYAKDAAHSAILAYNALLKRAHIDLAAAALTRKQNLRPKPLPPTAHKFLKACQSYAKAYPKDPRSIEVSYKAALLTYTFNHFSQALPRFAQLIKQHPTHEFATYAAHFILDTYNQQKRWDKLHSTAQAFARHPRLGNAKFKREIRQVLAASGFKRCQQLAKRRDHKACGVCHERHARSFANNKRLASLSWHNATICYTKAHLHLRALRASRTLLRKAPRARLHRKVLLTVAETYLFTGDFLRAAIYYERYLARYGIRNTRRQRKNTEARIAAAMAYKALDKPDLALEHYQTLLESPSLRRKSPKRLASLYLQVARTIGESDKRYSQMMKAFVTKRYGTPATRLFAQLEHLRTKQPRPTQQERNTTLARLQRVAKRLRPTAGQAGPLLDDALAHLAFDDAQVLHRDYTRLTWQPPMTRTHIKTLLQKKNIALKHAIQAYQRVAKTKQPRWAIAAYHQTGIVYEHFANFLLQAPGPDPLSTRRQATKTVKAALRKQLVAAFRKRRIPARYRNVLVKRYTRRLLRGPRLKALINRLVRKSAKQYEAAMDDKAQAIKAMALRFWRRGLRLAYQQQTYNIWTMRILRKLRAHNPKQTPHPHRHLPSPRLFSMDLPTPCPTQQTAPTSHPTSKPATTHAASSRPTSAPSATSHPSTRPSTHKHRPERPLRIQACLPCHRAKRLHLAKLQRRIRQAQKRLHAQQRPKPDPKQLSSLHSQLARLQLQSGDTKGARRHVRRALLYRPKNAAPYRLLAAVFLTEKQPQAVHVIAALAHRIGIRDARLLTLDGLAYLQQKHIQRAQKAFETALKRNPKSFDALMNLGLLALRHGHTRRAQKLLKRAATQRPHHRAASCAYALARL